VSENVVLEAQPRAITGKKVSQLRRSGLVPIVVYGPKAEPRNLQVEYRPLQVALMHAGGTHLIDLKSAGRTTTVLARQVQRDILRGDILHVDFFAVDLTAKISIDVPIHFINESPGVVAKKGILITGPAMLTIDTLPSHLIDQIEVDLSPLMEIGDAIHVRDLRLGGDITVLNDPDEMIARLSQTPAARAEEAEEEEAAEVTEGAVAEVEIIKKGKAEEEGEEA
jgi:large subunit ribosomal protein L25